MSKEIHDMQTEKPEQEVKKFLTEFNTLNPSPEKDAKIKLALVSLVGAYFEAGFDAGIKTLQEQLEEQGIFELNKNKK